MRGPQLVALLDAALARLADSRDELRDLDAALGDGDLGITVSKGCAAVQQRLATLDEPMPADVLKAAGAAFASGNPSTLAALVGGAVLAGARALADVDDVTREDAARFARAAADSVATRGKSQLGDKTMLDAMVPSVTVLEAADNGNALTAMIEAAQRAVADTTPLQSRRGRAAWMGERSAGQADPGATAYVRFLESLQAAWPAAS